MNKEERNKRIQELCDQIPVVPIICTSQEYFARSLDYMQMDKIMIIQEYLALVNSSEYKTPDYDTKKLIIDLYVKDRQRSQYFKTGIGPIKTVLN